MIRTLIKAGLSLFLAYGFFKATKPIITKLSGAMRLSFIVVVAFVLVVAMAKIWGEGE